MLPVTYRHPQYPVELPLRVALPLTNPIPVKVTSEPLSTAINPPRRVVHDWSELNTAPDSLEILRLVMLEIVMVAVIVMLLTTLISALLAMAFERAENDDTSVVSRRLPPSARVELREDRPESTTRLRSRGP